MKLLSHPRTQRQPASVVPALLATLLLGALGLPGHALAQTIERARLTDNDLSCTQMYGEVQQMENLIKLSVTGSSVGGVTPPVTPAVPTPSAANNALAALFGGGVGAVSPLPTQAINSGASSGYGGYGNQAAANQAQMQALMAASRNPEVRAAANDPVKVAQATALMQNPQLATAAQRAAASGVNTAYINSQIASAGAAQLAAANAGSLTQQQAQAQALAQQQAQQQAQNPAANFGNLLGALAGARGANTGGAGAAEVAGLFGALAGGVAQQPAPVQAVVPAYPVATPVATATPSVTPAVAAQAQGRKDHLTSLFLRKGCRMSDVKK